MSMKQATVDNLKLVDISKDDQPCTLEAQLKSARPLYPSTDAAVKALTDELYALADRHHMPLERLIDISGSALVTNDDYDRVRTIVRQLGFLQRG